MRNYILFAAISAALMSGFADAGPHTASKNRACPDGWAITDKAIPVVSSTSNPWGVPQNSVDDKEVAKSHLASARPIHTITALPVTSDELVNDPLTVASECLVYRNFEVDTWQYVAPPAVVPIPSNGWMSVVVF